MHLSCLRTEMHRRPVQSYLHEGWVEPVATSRDMKATVQTQKQESHVVMSIANQSHACAIDSSSWMMPHWHSSETAEAGWDMPPSVAGSQFNRLLFVTYRTAVILLSPFAGVLLDFATLSALRRAPPHTREIKAANVPCSDDNAPRTRCNLASLGEPPGGHTGR
jgi:hypothetical protein